MSTRSFADGRKLIGKKTSAKGRLDAAVLAGMEPLEQRQMLNAQVDPTNFSVPSPSGSTPLPPQPGTTFYVNAQGASNAWQWSSAITPNTVNDLVLNVQAYAQSYSACCEGNNAAVGNTGSVNAGRLLTNGLTQNQIGGFPSTGAVAATGSGSNSDASSGASVLSQNGGSWWLEYNLGSAPGQTPAPNGYDINEIDIIAGHQDYRTGMQSDVLVQYSGGNATDWFSLSNNANFNFTGLGRGSAQMAIQSPGGPMAQNVRAVKFLAANQQTWYRELVVTGAATASNVSQPPSVPGTPSVAQDPIPGAVDVIFAPSATGAQSYAVQRAQVVNGSPGAFTTLAGLVTTNNPTTFVDTTPAAGATYVYQIVAINSIGTTTSGISPTFTTPPIGAEAHYYNMAYWEGPATVNQGVAVVQLNWPSGSMASGIRGGNDSAVITGKVTPTSSGTYTFYSNTDDDGWLYVNGVLVSADPGGHGQRNAGSAVDVNNNPIGFAKPVTLTAGTSYNFVLLEHNSGGGAGANLVWRTPDGTLQVVPSSNLSPISDAPTAPTNLVQAGPVNSNYVNFTFTAENNAVVHYILQRALSTAPSVWTTVSQIDPGSDVYTQSLTVAPSNAHQFMTIQDAAPAAGLSYVYRVAAVNFDGAAATPAVQATLTAQADLVSPPTGTLTLGTAADATGTLTAGTYYVQYSWLNSAGGITAASAQTSIVTTSTGDVTVAVPAAPAGAINANVYLSNVSGGERFVGNVNGGQTLSVRGLPITAAAAAPASNTAGLVAGTYYVAYTWAGNETTVTGESSYASISNATRLLASNEASIVLASTNDILVNGFPAAPVGISGINVYIGTSSGSERYIGTAAPGGSLVINTLPSGAAKALPAAQINNTAFVSNTATANVPAIVGNPAGVEIHAYNQELFRRTSLAQVVEASAVAQNGLAGDYIAQTVNQTYIGGFYDGPIDRDYTAVIPTTFQNGPSSPDPAPFPDIYTNRIHTESFSQAFTATLTPAISGIYTLISNTDDDGFMWLDGTLVSADPGGHGQQDTQFSAPQYTNQPTRGGDTLVPVYLLAGQTYDLTMFMGNTGGGAGAHMKWVEPPGYNSDGSQKANTGVVVSGSNADQTGATLNINDSNNNSLTSNYNNFTIFITSGPGAGQAGIITNYNTQTKNFTVNVTTNGNQSLWSTIPTSASRFVISWVASIPLKGSDQDPNSNGNAGVTLHQDLPVQGTWSTVTGTVSLTTSASAAQNVTVTQVSPTAGVSLSWSDQGLGELWFEVQRSTDGVNFSTVGTTPMNFGTTFTDPSASNAYGSTTISYYYRVRGVNFDGAGPFSTVINTRNNVQIAAPQITQAIQGAPGTIGLVFSGGSPIAGGLDIQYATVNAGGTTGAFVDATPLGIPFNTFDYQVTGLVPTQQYVFKVRNLPGGNNVNSSLFGNVVAFTPVGGVQEAFGSPGTYTGTIPGTATGGFVGSGSVIGDVLVNTNASFTGPGVPAPATPSTPALGHPADMGNPFAAITGATSSTDAPAPTDAGTFSTSSQNLDLTGTNSVFIEYTWVTANGETLPFSTPQSFNIPSNTGVLLTYAIPSAPAGFGITNANIYIGTSTQPSALLLKGSLAPGTSTLITTFPAAGSKTVPTLSTTGVPAGTYFVKYAWTNSSGQTTAASPEQTFTLTNPSNDLFLPLPATNSANDSNFNLYVGTVSGGEKLAANVAANTTTLALRGIPISSAASAPTVNNAGLPVGTYYLQYSWNGTLPNENSTNEGLGSPVASVVVNAAGQDVSLVLPATPAGAGNANIYFGTDINVHSPVAAATLTTQADAASTLTTNKTYFVKYTWVAGTGETSTSPESSVVVGGSASDVLVALPAPFPGVTNGNIYISTNSGGEKLAGSFAAGATATIAALPATNAVTPPANTSGLFLLGQAAGGTTFLARSVPTSGNRPPIPGAVLSGPATLVGTADSVVTPTATQTLNIQGTSSDAASTIATGTYYLKYTWSGNGGETAASAEQTFTVDGSGPADVFIGVPAGPTGSGNANIYLGTTSGGETFLQSAPGNAQATLKTLPATNAAAAPTSSTVALPAGTYYVAYTWTSGSNLETAGSPEQTIVLAANSDLNVTPPINPVGAGNARIYLGTAPGQEFYTGNSVGALGTTTIRTIPNLNAKIVPNINSQAYRLTTPANSLQVTNNNGSQAGNAFNLGENIAGFTTSFDWVLEGNSSADGFGIVFTPDGRTYTGGSGGSMSYSGTSPSMQRSAAILFDTYDGNGTGRTGLGLNGNTPGNSGAGSGWIDMKTQNGVPTGVAVTNGNTVDRRSGDLINATINYDNNAHIITETVTDLTLKNRGVNNVFTTTYSIDLVATIGMPAAYVGFVGGTGGAQGEHDVLNWSFTNNTAIALDTITGTAAIDQITLTQDADHQHIDWTMNGNPQVYQETITSPNGLTINGNGSNDVITLNYANGNPLPNNLKLNGIFTINGLQPAVPMTGTKIDINRSTVFINYGSAANDASTLAAVQSYLGSGYNGGAWNGTSANGVITSSVAAANNAAAKTTTIGFADSADGTGVNTTANSVELMYTLIGDANLDASVNTLDFQAMLKHFNSSGTWTGGDFNYDGSVNTLDFQAMLKNFNTSLGSQAAVPAVTPAAAANSTTSSLSTTSNAVTLTPAASPAPTGTSDANKKKKVTKAVVTTVKPAVTTKNAKKNGK